MTKEETKKYISKCAKKTFSKSIKDIKKDLQENCKKNGFGCSDYLKDNENGYLFFYTDNANFCKGKKNGFGAGFYARLQFCGFVTDIKF
jgi:hypothetical protein